MRWGDVSDVAMLWGQLGVADIQEREKSYTVKSSSQVTRRRSLGILTMYSA